MIYIKNNEISLRKFEFTDIDNKVRWINNPSNNRFLHYHLPLTVEKTSEWYEKIKNSDNRIDAVIEYSGMPVGIIGLLNVDDVNRKAEYYICMGDEKFKGKGIAKKATLLLLDYAFDVLKLNRVYLYTEEENIHAQKLFKYVGFRREGLIKHDLIFEMRYVNRYIYGLTKEDFKNDYSYRKNVFRKE